MACEVDQGQSMTISGIFENLDEFLGRCAFSDQDLAQPMALRIRHEPTNRLDLGTEVLEPAPRPMVIGKSEQSNGAKVLQSMPKFHRGMP